MSAPGAENFKVELHAVGSPKLRITRQFNCTLMLYKIILYRIKLIFNLKYLHVTKRSP